ncbi:MAG: homoserine kinase [Nannocystaceae bacterium]|nr:homoserine kinase [Nannocystaceae bacterium]
MRARPWIEAFAPATVSNLGPGFDCLGLALRARGDTVRARRRDEPGVALLRVVGDGGALPCDERNTAAVAVAALLAAHAPGEGVELELDKGLPLGSGLGSSGASAAAAVVAVDAVLELGLPAAALVQAARAGEAAACGADHADNVAPAITGGIVLLPSLDPLRLVSLPVPPSLWLAVYTPGYSLPTAKARAALPTAVPLSRVVQQASRLGLLVHALHCGELALLGEAITDDIVEPARAPLIPGYLEAKAACCEAGAIACSISGAGPTTFAIASDRGRAEALLAILDEAFAAAGVAGDGFVDQVGGGARVTTGLLH